MATVPEIIVSRARDEGLRHFFGLPSSGVLLHLLEAGRREGLDFVSSAHESSGVISAAYYGHFCGTAGLAIGIQGVGAGNMVSGAINVHYERKPVVCVCECPPDDEWGEWGQQGDHRAYFSAVAKRHYRVNPDNIGQEIANAFQLAKGGRPGPVLVELPRDLGTQDGSATAVDESNPGGALGSSSETREALDRAVDMVASLKKPVIIVGDDARRQGVLSEVRSLAESLSAAVLVTMDGRGVFPEDDPRFGCVYIGTAPRHALYRSFIEESDGVLVIGADGRMKESRWDQHRPVCELIAEESFPALSGTPLVRVDGPLKPMLDRLSAVRNADGFAVSRIAALRSSIAHRFARPAAQFTAQDVIRVTREVLPEDGFLFAETGVPQSMLEYLWPVTRPNTFFGSTVGRTMGLTIPALLGACLARPEHPMVGLTTDGSALMRLGDLETFARTGASAPIVVFNDASLGTIRAQQNYQGLPDYGLDLQVVDFAAVARAVGLRGVTVDAPESFALALREAMQADIATVIDARVDGVAYRNSFMATTGVDPELDSSLGRRPDETRD